LDSQAVSESDLLMMMNESDNIKVAVSHKQKPSVKKVKQVKKDCIARVVAG
jgi:hypothetical protein